MSSAGNAWLAEQHLQWLGGPGSGNPNQARDAIGEWTASGGGGKTTGVPGGRIGGGGSGSGPGGSGSGSGSRSGSGSGSKTSLGRRGKTRKGKGKKGRTGKGKPPALTGKKQAQQAVKGLGALYGTITKPIEEERDPKQRKLMAKALVNFLTNAGYAASGRAKGDPTFSEANPPDWLDKAISSSPEAKKAWDAMVGKVGEIYAKNGHLGESDLVKPLIRKWFGKGGGA